MGHGKGAHLKVSHGEGLAHLDVLLHLIGHLTLDAVVMVDAVVDSLRRIDRHMILITERAYRLDMVCMVVGDQQVLHRLQLYAIVFAVFLQCAYSYAYIYHQSVCGSTEIIAVPAAATSKRYKSQHDIRIFVQRYDKK